MLGAHYLGGGTVSEAIANAIATIGENMTLRRVQGLRVAEGAIGHYVHGQIVDGLGRIGVIVGLESKGDREALAALGRQVAMHVAAASPIALNADGVDPATVARERSVLAEKNAGKPPHVIEKIVESGLKTYLQGGLPARPALRPRPGQERRAGGQGGGEDGRRADLGHRLRPLRARRRAWKSRRTRPDSLRHDKSGLPGRFFNDLTRRRPLRPAAALLDARRPARIDAEGETR